MRLNGQQDGDGCFRTGSFVGDDLIDGGVEVVNLQDLVNGIDWIAERFAGKVCVDLDIDRQQITRFGTPAEIGALIREEVEKLGSKEGEIESLERTRCELEAKIREAGGLEGFSQVISEVERGTAQTLASIAGNTQFLRLALEGGDTKLLRRVGEVEKGISELENLNIRAPGGSAG